MESVLSVSSFTTRVWKTLSSYSLPHCMYKLTRLIWMQRIPRVPEMFLVFVFSDGDLIDQKMSSLPSVFHGRQGGNEAFSDIHRWSSGSGLVFSCAWGLGGLFEPRGPLQYCKVISLQLIKNKWKQKTKNKPRGQPSIPQILSLWVWLGPGLLCCLETPG